MESERDEVRLSSAQYRSLLSMATDAGYLLPGEPGTGRRICFGVQLIPDSTSDAPAFKSMAEAADWVFIQQLDQRSVTDGL